MKTRALALATLLLLPALPAAAATRLTVDKAHSNVEFQVRHLMSKVRGSFAEFEGVVVMDPDPAKSSVSFTIEAKSIDTGNGQRDGHLRSGDFFDVDKHPTLTFRSTTVRKTGDTSYEVTGPLTMRGVSKVISLPVTFLGEVKDAWGNVKTGFSTSTTLNRQEFGIKWNKALDQGGFVLGDEVRVEIDLQFEPAK